MSDGNNKCFNYTERWNKLRTLRRFWFGVRIKPHKVYNIHFVLVTIVHKLMSVRPHVCKLNWALKVNTVSLSCHLYMFLFTLLITKLTRKCVIAEQWMTTLCCEGHWANRDLFLEANLLVSIALVHSAKPMGFVHLSLDYCRNKSVRYFCSLRKINTTMTLKYKCNL